MKFEDLDLRRLELNLMNGMKALRSRVVENYGIIPFLESKSVEEIGGNRVDFANSALTQIDLDIQEKVLQGLYDFMTSFRMLRLVWKKELLLPVRFKLDFMKMMEDLKY